jgi:hypothetical protein
MSKSSWKALTRRVYDRADGCCEYCRTSEKNTGQTMQVDHIDPDGGDILENLCLSCWNCNNLKRRAISTTDPETGMDVPLFNPRTDHWAEHFEWIEGATLLNGLTPVGRVTIERLKMKRPAVVIARHRWVQGGYHPPPQAQE